jgi:hypothetical protein
MFEIAVIGPFAAQRLGVVRQCIECRRSAGLDAPPCSGFGPGCLMTPACARDYSSFDTPLASKQR